MGERTTFIGHRKFFYPEEVRDRLCKAVEGQIKNGCKKFTMGAHGDFDQMALSVCKEKRRKYPDIEIEVVLTSYRSVYTEDGFGSYQDVKTVLYDVESEHFKRRITVSNEKMIYSCDTIVCYVDEKKKKSGAKQALQYARRKGLKIITVF